MRLGLVVVVLTLSWMHLAGSRGGLKGNRQRRISTERSQACTKGCELCSEVNGCLKCSPKLFILLERNDIPQVGICLSSCPPGYYYAYNPDMNKCIKFKIENCEARFSHNFCTKCKEGLYLHKGHCYPACPEGSSAANSTMECRSPAQCEMSEWSPWGPCSRKKKLCGFRQGSEEWTRLVLQAPSGDRSVCPSTKETRRCTAQKIPCPDGQKRRKDGQAEGRLPMGGKAGKKARKSAWAILLGGRDSSSSSSHLQHSTEGPKVPSHLPPRGDSRPWALETRSQCCYVYKSFTEMEDCCIAYSYTYTSVHS